jgi:hypothetical protein
MGFRTQYGLWLAPGTQVTYLGPAGVFEDTYTENNRVPTLAAAAARMRASKNDIIVALPGYSENISAAAYASLPAGTKLIGLGTPGEASAPKLTWTAAAATLLLNAADITIENMTLDWAGIDNVAAPITVSAVGCKLLNNLIIVQSAALSAGADQGVEVGVGGSGFKFNGNTCISVDEDEPLTGGGIVEISGAANDIEVKDNYLCGAAAATVGLVRVSAAATNLRIQKNLLMNLETTSGAVALLVSSATAQGAITDNDAKVMTGADPNAADIGFSFASSTLIYNARNYVVDDSDLGALTSEPHAGT